VEVAPGHYPLIVAVHAALLVSLWVFGRDQRVNFVAFVGYLVLQGFRFIPTMWWLPARSQ
jgi:methyltransferase